MACKFHHLFGMNCICLRFFTVYSPRGRPDMAPFKFIDRISNGIVNTTIWRFVAPLEIIHILMILPMVINLGNR